MQIQLELFDSTITYSDIELWLNGVARFTNDSRPSHVVQYIKDYDVLHKIRRAKTNLNFNQTVNYDKKNLSSDLNLFDTIKQHFKPRYKNINLIKSLIIEKPNTNTPLKIAA